MNRILEILQHALGRDEHGRLRRGAIEEHRNHFVAGGDDVALCRDAVASGWMLERPASPLTGGDPVFFVTNAGRDHVLAASPKPMRLTRGQKNYQRYLEVSDATGETFFEWLKRETRERWESRCHR